MNKIYSRIDWKNEPSVSTPLNEVNLNKMDSALNEIDNRIIQQDAIKASKTELANLVSDWNVDEETGVITITKVNGSKVIFDLNIEKVPVAFELSDDGILKMTTDDGTVFSANIGAMIPILTFEDSDTISVSVSGSGVNKTYSFSVKNGSITEDKLQPNYLAEIKVETAKSIQSATNAKTSENNAKTSETKALQYRNEAEEFANVADTESAYISTKATGNPITMQSTTQAELIDFNLHGGMSQDSTTGKQLFELGRNDSTSRNGVSFSFDKEKGTFTYNGTSTSEWTLTLGTITLKAGNSYTISACGNSPFAYKGLNGTSTVVDVGSTTPKTVDVTTDCELQIFKWFGANSTYNGIVTPMVRLASITDDTFEPYTNGASPNPDYLQHIQAVGDKGYFDGKLLQGYYFKDDGKFANNGKSQDICCKNSISVNGNDKVTIYYDGKVNAIRIVYYDDTDTYISSEMQGYSDGSNTISNAEFTAPSNCRYVRFNIYNIGHITPSTAKHISVTINGMYATEVKSCGKNLFNKDNATYISNLSFGQDKFNTANYPTRVYYIECLPNTTYTYSKTIGSFCRFGSCSEIPSIGAPISVMNNNTDAKSSTITTLENDKYLAFYPLLASELTSIGFDNVLADIQVELGDTSTDYEPYQETVAQIPLSEPLYYGDYIELFADGTGQIVRENKRVVYDGVNYKIQKSASTFNNLFYSTIDDCTFDVSSDLYCDRLAVSDPDTLYNSSATGISYYVNTSGKPGLRFGFGLDSELTTEDLANEWLQANNITVVYKLATPTITPLTAEQVAEIGKLQSFNEVTHVFAEDLASMDVEAYRNTDNGVVVSDINKQVKGLKDNTSQYAIGEGLFLRIRNGQLIVSNGTQQLSFVADSVVE